MALRFVTKNQSPIYFWYHFELNFAYLGVNLCHFGHPNGCQIATGTSLGSHRSPRRPPERPGVPFGQIWGSIWGQFWVTFGTKITPESMQQKQIICGDGFCDMLVAFRPHCWRCCGQFPVSRGECRRKRRTCVF